MVRYLQSTYSAKIHVRLQRENNMTLLIFQQFKVYSSDPQFCELLGIITSLRVSLRDCPFIYSLIQQTSVESLG